MTGGNGIEASKVNVHMPDESTHSRGLQAIKLYWCKIHRYSHGPSSLRPLTYPWAQVNISTDVDLGTIYSVALPIKRVKPVARVPMEDDVEVDGITLRWDSDDPDSDPSSEFPFGC